MTAEEKFCFQQIAEGNPPDQDLFRRTKTTMLPSAKEGAVEPWIAFIAEITESGQFVDFQEESDLGAAQSRWYDTLLAGFFQLKTKFGEANAAKVLELGLEGLCLYPYELEKAAEELRQGTGFERLCELMRDGLLESEGNLFPKLREVLAEETPAQNPRMDRNLQ